MYNIKVYNKALVYQSTISLKKVVSISNFSADINGWVGNMNLSLDLKITNTDFNIWDILKIYFESDHIYTWSVLDIKKEYLPEQETITLIMVWYAWLMTTLLKTETYSDIASNIAKDIIDDFNTEYWTSILSYDASSIPATVWTIDLTLTNKNYLDCLKELSDTVWLKFYIDIDGKCYFREKSAYTNHKLTTKKDVDSLVITEEWRFIKNTLLLDYNWWSKTYTDSASVTTYWKKEAYLNKANELWNVTTADEYWANYLIENADEKQKITITVNNKFDYFTIKCGDTIKVRNTWYSINNLQIVKITYYYEKAILELEKAYSFANEIFNN